MPEAEATDKIEACHEAFLEWRKLCHEDRALYLKKIGQTLRDNTDEWICVWFYSALLCILHQTPEKIAQYRQLTWAPLAIESIYEY